MPSDIIWEPKSREFLRKLPKNIAKRIYGKINNEIKYNAERYLETLVNRECYKIRIGNYRLFVDYNKNEGILIIRSIRHRRDAYKY